MTTAGGQRVVAPRRVDAELVAEKRMSSGRHQPLVIDARDEHDQLVRCVVKTRPKLTMPPTEYLLEWVGAATAREMKLTTPEPLAVDISPAFAESVDPALRTEMRASVGIAYGSRLVNPVEPLPAVYGLQPSQREIAARVLAFDVFIHNTDRRAENPNLFVTRSDVVVFDHEMAFDFLMPIIGAADPHVDHRPDLINRHPMFKALRGTAPAVESVRGSLKALDDSFFGAIPAATPVEWTTGQARGKLDKILEVLQKRRDAVDSWLPKVFACLDP